MSEHTSSRSNSYIFDTESGAEMARLIDQENTVTRGMKGPLSGIDDPSSLHTILDLACGPGGWAIDVAYALPEAEVAGVDISKIMIPYANARAHSQEIHNATFGVMDITGPLDFADSSFDLINARLLVAVLPRKQWSVLLQECYRILRPGGIVRLTECDEGGRTNSAAYERISSIASQTMHKAGYGFSPDGQTLGMSGALPSLLRRAGFQHVRLYAHPIDFSQGTEAYSDLTQNSSILYKQFQQQCVRMGLATDEEMNELHTQMKLDMLADNFCGTWTFWTALGEKLS